MVLYGGAFVIVAITACILIKHLGMPWVNVLTAFCFPWSLVVFVASIPGVVGPTIQPTTWLMVWVSLVSVILGTFVGWFLTGDRTSWIRIATEARTLDRRRLIKLHWFTVVTYATYWAIQISALLPVVLRVGGWGAIFSSSGNAYRSASIQASIANAQETLASGSILSATIGYVLYAIGGLSLFTGALLWQRRTRVLAVMPLALAGGYSLLTLQRTTAIIVTIVFIVSVISIRWTGVTLVNGTKPPKLTAQSGRFSAISVFIASIVGLAAVIFIPLQLRTAGTTKASGLASLVQYFLGGLAGLNSRNTSNPNWLLPPGSTTASWAATNGWGAYTFHGIFSILNRLGLPVPTAPVNLDYYPVQFFGQSTITNVGTALTNAYLDAGWVGIAVLLIVLGIAGATFQKRILTIHSFASIPVFSYIITMTFWTFFGSGFGDPRLMLTCFIAGPILNRSLVSRSRSDVPSAAIVDPHRGYSI